MVFLGMKRGREGAELDTLTTMANCLMLLSRSGAFESPTAADSSGGRVFECKTCNRQFPSFQALGGHRASHKKPRLIGGDLMSQQITQSPPKPKTHECSVCGLEFAIGQALGGHMRRHRAAAAAANDGRTPADLSLSTSRSQSPPVVKKSSNSSMRVLSLDLNLTPLENGLDFPLEKVAAPMLHCYL